MTLIKEKGAKDDTAVNLDFGQTQAALATGKYEVVEDASGEPGPEIHRGVMGEDPALTGGDPTPEPSKKADLPASGKSR